jgi:hypothetical protein
VAQILAGAGMPAQWAQDEAFVGAVCARLLRHMEHDLYPRKRAGFDALAEHVRSFYTGIVRLEDVQRAALEELQATDRSARPVAVAAPDAPLRRLSDATVGS